MEFPHVDGTTQGCITDQQAQFFRDNGLLVIRNVLRGDGWSHFFLELLGAGVWPAR